MRNSALTTVKPTAMPKPRATPEKKLITKRRRGWRKSSTHSATPALSRASMVLSIFSIKSVTHSGRVPFATTLSPLLRRSIPGKSRPYPPKEQGFPSSPAKYWGKTSCVGGRAFVSFPRSERLFARARRCIAGGVNSPSRSYDAVGGGAPRFIARGEGAYLYDVDGNRYIDYLAAFGAMILGHAHPRVVAAVQEAVTKGTVYGAPTEAEVKMAEALTGAIPQLEMVRFTASGTEAVMTALRLARGYTGRNKILKFDGAYHGHSDAVLVSAGSGSSTLGIDESLGVTPGVAKDVISIPYD